MFPGDVRQQLLKLSQTKKAYPVRDLIVDDGYTTTLQRIVDGLKR
jgi:hypothetical protein